MNALLRPHRDLRGANPRSLGQPLPAEAPLGGVSADGSEIVAHGPEPHRDLIAFAYKPLDPRGGVPQRRARNRGGRCS